MEAAHAPSEVLISGRHLELRVKDLGFRVEGLGLGSHFVGAA